MTPGFVAPLFSSSATTWSSATYQRSFADEETANKAVEAVKAAGAAGGVAVDVDTKREEYKVTQINWRPKPVAEKVLAALQEVDPKATIQDVMVVPGTRRYDTRFAERSDIETTKSVVYVTVTAKNATGKDLLAISKALDA